MVRHDVLGDAGVRDLRVLGGARIAGVWRGMHSLFTSTIPTGVVGVVSTANPADGDREAGGDVQTPSSAGACICSWQQLTSWGSVSLFGIGVARSTVEEAEGAQPVQSPHIRSTSLG